MNSIRKTLKQLRTRLIRARYPQLAAAFRITSHLTDQERIKLYQLSRGARRILEIGSYTGASACCFGSAMAGSKGGRIVCVDTWENQGMSEGLRNTWAEFQCNTDTYREMIFPVRGLSKEAVDQVRDVSDNFQVLFIDGDHSYAGVKSDWESYRRFLRSGSIVVFHDYGWAEGVRKVVHEDVMPVTRQIRSLPNMWWGRVVGE